MRGLVGSRNRQPQKVGSKTGHDGRSAQLREAHTTSWAGAVGVPGSSRVVCFVGRGSVSIMGQASTDGAEKMALRKSKWAKRGDVRRKVDGKLVIAKTG